MTVLAMRVPVLPDHLKEATIRRGETVVLAAIGRVGSCSKLTPSLSFERVVLGGLQHAPWVLSRPSLDWLVPFQASGSTIIARATCTINESQRMQADTNTITKAVSAPEWDHEDRGFEC